MGEYTPLNIWLVGQSAQLVNIHSTFEQIEEILGRELPPTARNRNQWWENNPTRHIQARAWLNAGFITQDVDLDRETLVFSRAQAN